ncbi:Pycsar system effector family protein [Streptomyces hydrogenans]|uniref:Pycsar system effector family protein n=1 Tax=Streptomyces hydrogenans TaxID=1873719 RepID=UPI0036E5796D
MNDSDARVQAATTTVLAEITRTDAKAGTLLSTVSLPLAALVAVLPGRDLPGPVAALVALGAAGLIAAMLTVLAAVRPRLAARARGNFLHWATCTPDELTTDLASRPDGAAQLINLSKIAVRKYRGLQLAGDITAVSLSLLALALLGDALL